jgi:hypothetical protein
MWTAASAMLAAVVIGGCEGRAPEQTGGTFVLMPVATFGLDSGMGALESVPVMSPPIDGKYHVITTPWGRGDHLPRVFDAGGRYVATIGTAGAGPGEFSSAEMVHTSADTVLIHDRNLKRMTWMVPPSTVVRSVPWPERPFTMIELPDGSFVSTSGDFDRGAPMVHLSRDGNVLREFGDVPPAESFEGRIRQLANDPRGGFWSVRATRRYELQQWSAPGELANTYALSTDWFPTIPREVQPSPTAPPSALLTAMWVDSVGTVWTVGLAADPQWYEAFDDEPVSTADRGGYPVRDIERLYDTMIERWDPKTQTLLFSERRDEVYAIAAGPWLMARMTENGDGFVKVELVRVVPR